MKQKLIPALLFLLTLTGLSSCGSSESSSAEGPFGNIPSTVAKYEADRKEAAGPKESDDLYNATREAVENEAKNISGKEIACTVDETQFKVNKPLTFVYDSMNKYRANLKLDGEVVTVSDITLKADPSDLKEKDLLGEYVISVRMPVAFEMLDKDGNVVEKKTQVGILQGEVADGKAIVKAGTPIEFTNLLTISDKQEGVVSFRLFIDPEANAFTSRSLKM